MVGDLHLWLGIYICGRGLTFVVVGLHCCGVGNGAWQEGGDNIDVN